MLALKRVLKDYVLYQLNRASIGRTDLVPMHRSSVRPVLAYACHVWHANFPRYLSDNIEMIPKKIGLKSIFHDT